ncbi:L,D-transpeptidase [Rhodoblastus sp.]|uniref:L,D-transpeptidase n=1 Tax=Rhodoblastus sp. TaxID=1962975 RepID=UPI003F9EA12A
MAAPQAKAQFWTPFGAQPPQQQQQQQPQHPTRRHPQRQAKQHPAQQPQQQAAQPRQSPFFWWDNAQPTQPQPTRSTLVRPPQPQEAARDDDGEIDLSRHNAGYEDGYGDRGGVTEAALPPDADPNYSTPVNLDPQVIEKYATRTEVSDPTGEPAGTITISTAKRKLYYSLGDGKAVQYGVAVGKAGFAWKGEATVGRKSYWPGWTPPPEMLDRRPELPEHMDGSLSNPLGARALYLFQGTKDTLFRIHGTNEPKSIGHAASSGCIRMENADIIDLYGRVSKGTRVVVR